MTIVKRRKIEVVVEKQLLTGMIVSTQFLQKFKYLYKPELFQMPFSKILSGWCWDYFEKYGKAPNIDIQDIFREKGESLDDALFQAIEGMLLNLSDSYETGDKINVKRLLDKSEEYMQGRNMEGLLMEAGTLLENKRLQEAELLIKGFAQIKRPESDGIDMVENADEVAKLIDKDHGDILFRFKGAAGRVLPPICREEFTAFIGPEKRGKSWNLQEVGKQGVLRGYKVVHFNFEMPQTKLVSRYMQSFTGHPGTKEDENCLIPIFDCELNQTGDCKRANKLGINATPLTRNHTRELPKFKEANPNYKVCSLCKDSPKDDFRIRYMPAIWFKKNTKKALTGKTALYEINKLKPYIRSGGLRWVSWPSDTKSCADIKNQLLLWEELDGWIPDIIITDYADLMIAENAGNEYRHNLDSIWKNHKKLGQEFHAAIFSATQATKDTHERRVKEGSIAEDKRKSSHVDRMIALNQTEDDRAKNLMRWSILFERHGERIMKDIVILQQLKLGNPYLDSYIEENPARLKKRNVKTRR